MFDTIRCCYPLPHHQDAEFQTKDVSVFVYEDPCLGGTMEDYEITEDGRLRRHAHEREWMQDPGALAGGYFRSMRDWWEDVPDAHGDILIYTCDEHAAAPGTLMEFRIRFTNGRVENVTEVVRDAEERPECGDGGGATVLPASADIDDRPEVAALLATNRPSDMQPARAEPIRFTYEDYLGFPDDGRRHELVDGEHVVAPAPTRHHQELFGRLFLALGNHLAAHPLGRVYAAPIDVILSDTDVVQPDIVYVSNERSHVLGTWIHGAPDLAVEIVSPSSRRHDEVLKRRLFDRFDVREYWVVDPETETVKVYRRTEGGDFPRAAELSRGPRLRSGRPERARRSKSRGEDGQVLESPLLPGLAIDLRDLFA